MSIINKIKVFLADENGAETVEWVVVCAGIAAIAAGIYSTTGAGSLTLSTAITGVMTKIIDTIK